MPDAERERLSPPEGYERNFDWQRLRDEVLAPLASGQDAAYQRYDWATGCLAPAELHTVSSSGIVVVEGVYAGRPELEHFYDLLVWVDTPAEVSWQRLRERGDDHGPIDWEARWRLAEEHYVAATNPQARAHITVKSDRHGLPNPSDQP
jgi:pantothenate kinase